jgi:hypothetical protein
MSAKRVLVCSYFVPQTDRDTGSRRIADLVAFLQDTGYTVAFHATSTEGDARYTRELQQHGVVVFDGRRTALAELLTDVAFDLVLIAYWPLAELYLPVIRANSPHTSVVIDSIDLHLLREARGILRGGRSGAPAGLLDPEFAAQFIGEVNTYAAADAVLTVSQKEANWINDLVGPGHAQCVQLAEHLAPSPVPCSDRRGILFMGDFRHAPNVEAVDFLCREVLPRVDRGLLEAHPAYIVGNAIGEDVRGFTARCDHARVVGWVPSVLPYLERTRVTVLPLRFGAGVKGKLIQALMIGTPTVATEIGVEGLDVRDGEHVRVADDPKEFALAMEELLCDDQTWHRLAEAGRSYATAAHSRHSVSAVFQDTLHAILDRPVKPPLLPDGGKSVYHQRLTYQESQRRRRQQHRYDEVVNALRDTVCKIAPPDATVAVVSKGDDALVQLNGRSGWHFPRMDDGTHAGHHPADSDEAIAHLEALRSRGADYLAIPATALWWLRHYPEFAEHLKQFYPMVAETPLCHVYSLVPGPESERRENTHEATTSISRPSAVRTSSHGLSDPDGVRLIAFYLPQFHPIPENDAWWGEGFTEWTNVTRARSLFPGHDQPRRPADLGFYDLRLPDVREAQAALARAHGIHGFCYYHYWFGGKQLLERPFQEVLHSGKPDFPFCLCWANEPWSRRWDGMEHDVLQPQTYSAEDDAQHIAWLIPALKDRRAIRVDDRPLLMIYQAQKLPDPARTVECWRAAAKGAGLAGIYFMSVETGWDAGWDATQVGFDAKVLFQPQFTMLRGTPRTEIEGKERLQVYDYGKAWPVLANPEPVPYRRYDTVFPQWDNSPRSGAFGTVVHNSTPASYEQWLRVAIERAKTFPAGERLVFINAWNEWAEGAYLEPDARFGHAYLEATQRALASADSMVVSAIRGPKIESEKAKAYIGAPHLPSERAGGGRIAALLQA